MKKLFSYYLFLLFFLGIYSLHSQTLTISSTGQTSSPGTNWSLTGNTLTVTGTANIRASVIVDALANGNLTVVGNTSTFSVTVSEAITATGNNTLAVGSATNTGTITFNAVTSFAGPVTVNGGDITVSQNLTSTLAGADILLQASGAINLSSSTTIQTSSGDITFRANAGGTAVVTPSSSIGAITLNSGSSLLSTGGNITLGGNFNGTKGTGLYAASARVGGAPGILISNATLTAVGGNINIYGSCTTSYDDGIRLQATISTTGIGTIGIYGDAYGGLLDASPDVFFGGITFITNSSTIETDAGNINIEATLTNTQSNGTYALNFYRTNFTTGTSNKHIQLLSKSGNIQVTGDRGSTAAGGMGSSSWGDIYVGSPLDASWTATGNIKFSYSSFVGATDNGILAKTTGGVTYEPVSTSFSAAQTFPYNSNYTLAASASSLTIGKAGNSANITMNSAQTIAGPISIYGGYVNINGNLTSSATGDIFIKGIAGTNPSIWIKSGKTITKSGGTGTLTMQGHGRVSNSGSITTSGTGVLNVIFWSDFDNSNNDGGVSQFGTVSTNGGHVWLGGSNSNGGSYTWNGLTVGDGPSIGTSGFNGNAMDIYGNITTNGGDLLVWAGNGSGGGTDGIVTNAGWELNVSDGDVVFITPSVLGSGPSLLLRQNGGTFTLVPNGTSFPVALNWSPSDSVYSGMVNWNFPDEFNYLWIENPTTLTNLTVGRYDGMSSGGNPVVLLNTSNININLPNTIAGSMSFYGGALALNSNLTTTNATTGNITLSGTTISGTGNIALASGRNATLNISATSTYDGVVSGTVSALTKSGSGKLMLTKDQTYSGVTTITAGDLQVGTGGSVDQASSGSISNTSAVAVASGSKLILTPNENILFAAPISGAGGVEIKGASGLYRGTALTTTASLIASNVSVLEVLTRITGGTFTGSAGSGNCGAYQKSYNAATNTATLQFQQFVSPYTKVVFVTLERINTTDVAIKGTGAVYRSGDYLGQNMATIGTTTAVTFPTQYGISQVFMSGKVNFTGALTYTGTTTLSNTTTSSTSPTTYSYISKGTQEITDASSSFPSAIVNNGLVILNRTTPLTIAGDMSGTEDILQVGADVTFTGTNTHTGTTTIDLNKTLNIGSGGSTGSMTSNIVNYGALAFNRTGNSTFPGMISGSGTVTKSGSGDLTLNNLNTYTGSTTINNGRFILERDVPATSSSGYSGIGTLVIQPSSNSFTSAVSYPIAGFTVSSSIGGLTLGKPTNSANITFTNATQAAGPITAYGGTITLNTNITTTNNGDVSLYTDNAIGGLTTTARTITAAGSFNYIPRSDFFSAPVTYPITNLNLTSSGLLIGKSTNTAAITFATATSIAGPITTYGGTITLDANLTTTNNGSISLYTDNTLGGLSTARTLTAAGAFKYIPRATTFTADVTYPITNLTSTSTGLTIGKTTNDKNITINADVTGGAGIELYGNNVNINANLKTTSGGAMYLKGITTIAAGKYIESNGAFTHDGNMTFKSDVTGTAAFGTLGGTFTTVSGNTTVERYFPAKRVFRFVSSAVTTTSDIRTNWQENGGTAAGLGTHITGVNGATNGFDTTTSNNPSMFTFNNTSAAWVPVTSTISNTLTAGVPYRVNIRGDRTINLSTNTPTATITTLRATGALATGPINAGTLSASAYAYNFIGNPYQAPVNMKMALDAATNLNNVIYYVWDPKMNTRGAYISVDLTTTNGTPNNGTSYANKYLQPGQACFVRTGATAGAASLNFQEIYKAVDAPNQLVFKNTVQDAAELSNIRLNLYDSNSLALNLSALDGLLVFFDDAYSNDVDQNDGGKFANPDEMLSTYNSGALVSIEKRMQPTTNDILPLRISQYRGTDYTLVAQGTNLNGVPAYLHDQFLQTYTEIPQSGSINYPFSIVTANTQTTATDRFRIVYTNPLLSTNNTEWMHFTLYPNPSKQGNFNINFPQLVNSGKVTIYNTLGEKVHTQDLNATIQTAINPNKPLATGIYYVEIEIEANKTVKKLIIE